MLGELIKRAEMGATNSRAEKNEALSLCKERKRFVKVAIDSRYALAAAHVSIDGDSIGDFKSWALNN